MKTVNVIESPDEFVLMLQKGLLQGKVALMIPKLPMSIQIQSEEYRLADGMTLEQVILAMCQLVSLDVKRV